MTNTFSALYAEWLESLDREDPTLRKQLADRYRAAWAMGDREERYMVLDFIRRTRLNAGLDLVIEGLRIDDAGLATHAAAVALFLISQGVSFDVSIHSALHDFGHRFPNARVLSDSALRRIGESA